MSIPQVIQDTTLLTQGPRGKEGRKGFDGRHGKDGIQGEQGEQGESIIPVGPWKLQTNYNRGEIVTYSGSSYIALQDNAQRIPSLGAKGYWMILAAKGKDGESGGQGFRGRAGVDADASTVLTQKAVFDSVTTIGQPVYITTSGGVELADASSESTSIVVGLANAEVSNAGGAGSFITDGSLSMPDWTNVTGQVQLEPGSMYFLDTTPGMLSTTSADNAGDVYAPVGVALSETTLSIEILTRLIL